MPRLATAALFATLLLGCGAASDLPVQAELIVFGSRAEVQLRELAPADAERSLALITRHFREFESEWHAWQDSALTRFNSACAAGQPARVPASVAQLIERSQQLASSSGGLFDPGMGGLVRLWGFHTSDYPIRSAEPAVEAIEAWLRAGPSVLDIERLEDGRLRCRKPSIQLDFGAIAEGAALARIGFALRQNGVRHALLNLGGDVLALGSAFERPWRVAIRDPRGGALGVVELVDGESLFSSGSYAKFREHADGSRWPHLLDPRSGQPVRHSLAASVIHRDPELADAAATALMIAGPAGFESMRARLGIELALLLDAEGSLHTSPGMRARLGLSTPNAD